MSGMGAADFMVVLAHKDPALRAPVRAAVIGLLICRKRATGVASLAKLKGLTWLCVRTAVELVTNTGAARPSARKRVGG